MSRVKRRRGILLIIELLQEVEDEINDSIDSDTKELAASVVREV